MLKHRRQKRRKADTYHRTLHAEFVRSDSDDTVTVSVSSEAPVERGEGVFEILDHSPQSVDLRRIRKGHVLYNHDATKVVGRVVDVWLDEAKRKIYAKLQLGKTNLARDTLQNIRDGILNGFSIGYAIINYVQQGARMLVDRWVITEISVTPTPADLAVGHGRSHHTNPPKWRNHMQTTENKELEKLRHEKQIRDLAADHRGRGYSVDEYTVTRAIAQGQNVNDFAASLWNGIPTPGAGADQSVLEDMRRESKREFSLCRALSGALSREGITGFEAEVMQEHCAKTGQRMAADSILIPFEALGQRSMLAGSYGAGGSTVATDMGALIPKLDPQPVVEQAGATFLRGLTAPTSLPRHTTAAIAEWVAEAQEVSKSTPGTDDVMLTPHGLACYSEVSRQLAITSSIDVEAFLRQELLRRLNLGIDKAALVGSGVSGTPKGLFSLAEAAINSVTFGGSPTWAKIVEFGGEVEDQDGANGRLSWVTSAPVKAKWQATTKDEGSGMFLAEGDLANGSRIHVTSQLRGTAGEDRVLFGDFSQLVVSTFGALEVLVDQSAALHRRGLIGLTALVHADVAIRQGKAFARSTDKGNQ